MAKTDVEINIGRKFFIIFFTAIGLIVLFILLFQVYDSSKKKEFYHKMYTAVTESKELKEISRLINKIDTTGMAWMKAPIVMSNHNNVQCLGIENTSVSDSISAQLNKFIQNNSDLVDDIYVRFKYGSYLVQFIYNKYGSGSCNLYADFEYTNTNNPDIYKNLEQKGKISEEEMFEQLVENKNFRLIERLDGSVFQVFVEASKYGY